MDQRMAHRRPTTPLRAQYERNRQSGKREEPAGGRGPRRITRLVISGLLLSVVIAVKLMMPEVLGQYRQQILSWMGEDTDFVSAFSAVGRAIGEEGIGEALNDAYTAVFGGELMEDTASDAPSDRSRIVYDDENTPSDAELLQAVLGFDYRSPLSGTLTSCFGYRENPTKRGEGFHYGIDIGAEEGSVISSFADGEVMAVGDSSELGKYIEILHADGYTTLYAHCSRITASSGQQVRIGDPVAEVGHTGNATGDHLHFALYRDTLYLNPIYYVSL